MTKKGSIFKILGEYFRTHPAAVAGWIWISIAPAIGSLVLLSSYFWLEKISIASIQDHLLLSLSIALVLGLALLPTTLTAMAIGFFLGWSGLPDLLIGYILANGLGYTIGKRLNVDFLKILYLKNPQLETELELRTQHPERLIFFVRISPVIPFAISNFLFASLKIGLKKVILFGIPGMLPRTFLAFATGTFASSFLGAKESTNHPLQWSILIGLTLLSVWGIYRSLKKGKT
jgi:uncharacterized membrane protein YdjX (TVP38/TMEM64 family)